jgi:hypothetical protein
MKVERDLLEIRSVILISSQHQYLFKMQFLSIYLCMTLQPLWTLVGGSAILKAATCKRNNINMELNQIDIHASSGIRTYDPSPRAGEDG